MGIPEDYFRLTGETMGQACERMKHTHTIKATAQLIGYSTASGLQFALRQRGIEIDWPTSIPARANHRNRISDAELDRFIALRHSGIPGAEAARRVGRDLRAISRVLGQRRPGIQFERAPCRHQARAA